MLTQTTFNYPPKKLAENAQMSVRLKVPCYDMVEKKDETVIVKAYHNIDINYDGTITLHEHSDKKLMEYDRLYENLCGVKPYSACEYWINLNGIRNSCSSFDNVEEIVEILSWEITNISEWTDRSRQTLFQGFNISIDNNLTDTNYELYNNPQFGIEYLKTYLSYSNNKLPPNIIYLKKLNDYTYLKFNNKAKDREKTLLIALKEWLLTNVDPRYVVELNMLGYNPAQIKKVYSLLSSHFLENEKKYSSKNVSEWQKEINIQNQLRGLTQMWENWQLVPEDLVEFLEKYPHFIPLEDTPISLHHYGKNFNFKNTAFTQLVKKVNKNLYQNDPKKYSQTENDIKKILLGEYTVFYNKDYEDYHTQTFSTRLSTDISSTGIYTTEGVWVNFKELTGRLTKQLSE